MIRHSCAGTRAPQGGNLCANVRRRSGFTCCGQSNPASLTRSRNILYVQSLPRQRKAAFTRCIDSLKPHALSLLRHSRNRQEMSKDFIGYHQALTADAALRGVVREALRRVEKQGLIGRASFLPDFQDEVSRPRDSRIPAREQYPDEMTIILQHHLRGLKVKERSFRGDADVHANCPQRSTILYEALTAFFDPGVQFGLQFTRRRGRCQTDDRAAN